MKLIYTNQVDLTERTGQGTHEKEISALLLDDLSIEGVYVGQKPESSYVYDDKERTYFLVLNKTVLGYILYQIKLFFILIKLCKFENVVIFQRYAPAMIAPAIVSYIFKIPLVTRTGPTIRNLGVYEKPNNAVFKFLLNILIKFNYKVSSAVVVVTQTIKKYLLDNYTLNSEKIIVVSNGFNPEVFRLNEDSSNPSSSNNYFIFFAGSFHKDTGIDDLVEAILILAERLGGQKTCILAGDGPLRRVLQQRVLDSECKWDIKFPGRILQQELNSLLNQSAVGVVPFNTLGLTETGSAAVKVFEYLATGTPVVATRHSDHEFIEVNALGLLCNPDDPDDMANCLINFAGGEFGFDKRYLSAYAIKHGTWRRSYEMLKGSCLKALAEAHR